MAKERARFPVVVHIVLRRADEIFLLRRANTGFMDGYFGLPGGHQEHGESVTEAVIRECLEETGVTPVGPEPMAVFPYNNKGYQGFNFVFVTETWTGEPHNAESDQADHAGFHPIHRLPEPNAPWLANVLALLEGDRGFHFEELRWD